MVSSGIPISERPEQGDLQINLLRKVSASGKPCHCARRSATSVRSDEACGTVVKVVKVPLAAGSRDAPCRSLWPDEAARRATATKVREAFQKVDFVVDVDDTFTSRAIGCAFDQQENLEFYASMNSRL